MFEEIVEGLYVIYPEDGLSSNCYLLLGKKIALIDSGLKSNELNILTALKELGLAPEKVDLVLHSHGHADHFSCDFLFSNAEIRMHENDAIMLREKDVKGTASNFFASNFFPSVKNFFKESEVIDLGKFRLQVVFTPGHSMGSVCFFEKQRKLLFSGDTLFENGFGKTDLKGGNQMALKTSLQKLTSIKFDVLLPGHGRIVRKKGKQNLLSVLNLLE